LRFQEPAAGRLHHAQKTLTESTVDKFYLVEYAINKTAGFETAILELSGRDGLIFQCGARKSLLIIAQFRESHGTIIARSTGSADKSVMFR
jgi:hypothetical protein